MRDFRYYLEINSKAGKYSGIIKEKVTEIMRGANFDFKVVRVASNMNLNEIDIKSIIEIGPELILVGDELIRANGIENFHDTAELFKGIAALFRKNSIASRVALATNSKTVFAIGVENIVKLISEFVGQNKGLLALDFENHADNLPKKIINELDPVRAVISLLPDSIECIPIIGSKCYSTFSKSIKFTKLQISIAATLGFESVILDLFNLNSKYEFGEKEMQMMLSKNKKKFSALANAKNSSNESVAAESEGIFIPQPKVCWWSQIFQRLGFPVKFVATGNDVAAFMGDSILEFGKDEILNFLSHSLLLDGKAACALIEEGYGEYLGVEFMGDINTESRPFGAEEANVIVRDNVMVNYLGILWITRTHDWDGVVYFKKFKLCEGAKEITRLLDPDREPIIPGWIIYENKLGGRVAIHSAEIFGYPSQGQYSWGRAKLMFEILSWLSNNNPLVWNESNPDILSFYDISDSDKFEILSVTNLSMDDCESVGLLLKGNSNSEIETIFSISENGTWDNVEFSKEEATDIVGIDNETDEKIFRIVIGKSVEYLESEVFKLIRGTK